MKKMIHRFLHWWGTQKSLPFVLIGYVLYLMLYNTFINIIGLWLENTSANIQKGVDSIFPENSNYLLVFLMSCIYSPVVETLIGQHVLIRLIRHFLSKKWFWQVLLSGICFGLPHYYNYTYVLASSIVGMFFSFCFVLYEHYTDTNRATFAVIALHALINCIAFLNQLYLHIFS